MANELISVIVPVHNTEKYLRECLDSVLGQIYGNIELIAVDNSSSDRSGDICDEYAARDKRVTVIHQRNMGVSGARNTGLRLAQGAYIAFADSDDVLDSRMFEELYRLVKDCDMSCCGYARIGADGKRLGAAGRAGKEKSMSAKAFLRILFGMTRRSYQGYIWNKLYKNSIIRDNGIFFDEAVSYNEDRLFLCRYLLRCRKCVLAEEELYYYRSRSESAMGSLEKKFNKKALTELDAYMKMEGLLTDYPFIRAGMRVQEHTSAKKLLDIAPEEEKEYIRNFMKRKGLAAGKIAVCVSKLYDTLPTIKA